MTAVLVLALGLAAPPDDYNLMWKLKEGDTFYSRGKVNIEQSFTVMGRNVDQEMATETVTRFKVKSTRPGATVVEMTYLANKVTAKGLPGADAADGKLKGVTITATLDGKLEVTKIEGYEKILDALAGDNEQLRAVVKGTLPEVAVKQMFNDTFALVPGGIAKVGGTWKRNDTLPVAGLGDITTASGYKLYSVTGGVAAVSWTATGKFKEGDGTLPGLPLKITKLDLKIEKLSGGYTFDVSAGRIKESKTEMRLSGGLTLMANDKEVSMDVKQKLTQSATISDRNPVKD